MISKNFSKKTIRSYPLNETLKDRTLSIETIGRSSVSVHVTPETKDGQEASIHVSDIATHVFTKDGKFQIVVKYDGSVGIYDRKTTELVHGYNPPQQAETPVIEA